MRILEGKTDARGLRFGLIISVFNPLITEGLSCGALKVLEKKGAQPEDIEIAKVPGAFEIPGVAQRMGQLGYFDALICLGAVIQGETPHFQFIAAEVTRRIGQLSLDLKLPVIFGILTTDTMEQAIARSGDKQNKGAEAALAAIEMANLYCTLKDKFPLK